MISSSTASLQKIRSGIGEKQRGVELVAVRLTSDFGFEGNQMHLAVPRDVLGLAKILSLSTSSAGQHQLPDDLTVLYTDGDTAPLGRFRFRYATP